MSISKTYLVAIVTAACLAMVQSANANPLPLPNPGFEDGLQGWNRPEEDAGMSEANAEAARSGKMGLRVTDQSGSAGSSLSSQRLNCRAGEGYELTFYARLARGSGIGVYLLFYDQQGRRIGRQDAFVTSIRGTSAEDGWQRLQAAAVAPDGARQVAVWVHSYNSSKVIADFDDFTLRQIPAAQARELAQEIAKTNAANSTASNWERQVRKITLPDFPKTNPEQFLAQMKVLDKGGAALRAPQEDWQGARQRVASDPQWQAWAEQRQQEVRNWMARHKDRAEWRAGWWHDFVSPKDSSFLVWTEEVPGEEVEFLYSNSDPQVKITPKIFNAWVFGFRKRHAEKIREAAQLWRLTGNPEYRDWALEQIDFYVDNYEQWPVGGRLGRARLTSQSLDEAVNMIFLTDATRLLFDDLPEAKRALWYQKFFRPQAELLEQSFQQIHNIAAWQRSASAQIGMLFGDEELLQRQLDGEFGIRNQLLKGVTSDYIWYEQAMGYNSYVVNAINPLLSFAGLIGKRDLLLEEGAVLQNMLLSPLRLRFPDSTLPNPADAHRPAKVGMRGLSNLYRTLPTYAGIALQQSAQNWDTLLDPPLEILTQEGISSEALRGQETQFPPVTPALLESSRFALIQGGPWQVFMHIGQLHISHAQHEALNWSASYEGVDVSHDPGTVGYGSPMHAGYYRRSLNHNVPMANGWGQNTWQSGEVIEFAAEGNRISASQPLYRSDISATRTLSIEGDTFTDSVQIEHRGKDPRGAKMGLTLHLQGTLEAQTALADVADFTAAVRASLEDWHATTASRNPVQPLDNIVSQFKYWQDVKKADFTNEANFVLTLQDGKKLNVQIRTEGEFEIYVGSSPDYPPLRRTGIYVQHKDGSKKAEFTTVFSPAPAR